MQNNPTSTHPTSDSQNSYIAPFRSKRLRNVGGTVNYSDHCFGFSSQTSQRDGVVKSEPTPRDSHTAVSLVMNYLGYYWDESIEGFAYFKHLRHKVGDIRENFVAA
ncbi:hypothetical protein P8452_42413 [Trifolium repens]|nr:hypothetical protein P8452_42413 [Trifolium repens]